MDGDSANVFSKHWFLGVTAYSADRHTLLQWRIKLCRPSLMFGECSFGRDVRSLGARRDETLSLKYNVEKHLGKHIFVPLY